MLRITIDPSEQWDEEREEFVYTNIKPGAFSCLRFQMGIKMGKTVYIKRAYQLRRNNRLYQMYDHNPEYKSQSIWISHK